MLILENYTSKKCRFSFVLISTQFLLPALFPRCSDFISISPKKFSRSLNISPTEGQTRYVWKDVEYSERKYGVVVENDVKIPTRDGRAKRGHFFARMKIRKNFLQSWAFTRLPVDLPPIRPKANSTTAGGWAATVEKPNSPMEAGDPEFYARRGYVHVICNVRGTDSEGLYDFVGRKEVEDVYDVIEWIAERPGATAMSECLEFRILPGFNNLPRRLTRLISSVFSPLCSDRFLQGRRLPRRNTFALGAELEKVALQSEDAQHHA